MFYLSKKIYFHLLKGQTQQGAFTTLLSPQTSLQKITFFKGAEIKTQFLRLKQTLWNTEIINCILKNAVPILPFWKP